MNRFYYNYVDLNEATPRTEYSGSVIAIDKEDAAFRAWFKLSEEGSNCQIFNIVKHTRVN